MEKKEISKNHEKLYDTPEKTTKFVLDFVADWGESAVDDLNHKKEDHRIVQREEKHLNGDGDVIGLLRSVISQGRPENGGTVMSHHRGVFGSCKISSIAIHPGVPVEASSYG
ncbi:hypothetical protein TWF694_007487 [Orbilia ellipsospora]|uniref:Uncharacterized protein n=1 Tax=Orbilia ellipsospora TaxID=2528407 RepID=A0AAV9XKH0_9PEZI